MIPETPFSEVMVWCDKQMGHKSEFPAVDWNDVFVFLFLVHCLYDIREVFGDGGVVFHSPALEYIGSVDISAHYSGQPTVMLLMNFRKWSFLILRDKRYLSIVCASLYSPI